MKYKYIGTEQQLVERGFERENYDYDGYSYSRCQKKSKKSDIVIFFNSRLYEDEVFMHNWDEHDNCYIKPYIQDLIDDGLVEVVE